MRRTAQRTSTQFVQKAVVDMARLVVANQFGRYEAAIEGEDMDKNAYNKVAASAAWLVRRCEEVLDESTFSVG